MNYCGRLFSEADLSLIRSLIQQYPQASRRELSRRVCQALSWFKPDGGVKDMSCRVALLRMHRDGVIELPELPAPPPQNFQRRRMPMRSAASDPQPELAHPVDQLPRLQFLPVTADNPKSSRLWNEYIQRYHYLGYTPLSGAQMRYFVAIETQFLALLSFGASAWHLAPRDQFIGWSPQQREQHRHLVINNARFLILPWVRSKGLASKILGHIARRLPGDWQQRYGYRPVLMETFVQAPRYRGTCYKAANWIHIGRTQGRGKLDRTNQYALPVKDIWLYPLHRQFREILTQPQVPAVPAG